MRNLEGLMVQQCAPTLAGLKTASLFCLPCSSEEARALVVTWNNALNSRGVEARLLRAGDRRTLFYLFRPKKLRADWARPGVAEFLRAHGYAPAFPLEHNLSRLEARVRGEAFPHEIGLFLGYPLEDVQGFIENNGENFCCCGYWKVYGNPCEAERCFASFRKCRDVYFRRYQEGRSISRLTVAV